MSCKNLVNFNFIFVLLFQQIRQASAMDLPIDEDFGLFRAWLNLQTLPSHVNFKDEENKKIDKILPFDSQILSFVSVIAQPDSGFWLPKEVVLTIARTKAWHSAENLELGAFVTVPGGTYEIGSPPTEAGRFNDEHIQSKRLSPFSIMDAALTQESYAKVMGSNPSRFKEEKYCPLSFKEIVVNGVKIQVCADHPVENIDYYNVEKFINRLNKPGLKYIYSLPTELQIEVAFRGGTRTAYVTGRDDQAGLGNFVWHRDNSGNQTHPVKSKRKNAFNIYRSPVWEWTSDFYERDFPSRAKYRVVRGGSWRAGIHDCRSAYRNRFDPNTKSDDIGFRLMRRSI
jgi:formylglycine-generating enzyme required for sulfatase activity